MPNLAFQIGAVAAIFSSAALLWGEESHAEKPTDEVELKLTLKGLYLTSTSTTPYRVNLWNGVLLTLKDAEGEAIRWAQHGSEHHPYPPPSESLPVLTPVAPQSLPLSIRFEPTLRSLIISSRWGVFWESSSLSPGLYQLTAEIPPRSPHSDSFIDRGMIKSVGEKGYWQLQHQPHRASQPLLFHINQEGKLYEPDSD